MYELIKNQQEGIFDVYISGSITNSISKRAVEDIKLANKAGFKKLILHINSFGGSVPGSWNIVSAIKSTDLHVTTINEGFALSAASVLLAVGDERMAFDFSTAMVHDPLLNQKTLEETEGKDRELLTKVKDGVLSVYKKVFKTPIENISKMLTDTVYFNAEEQLEIGLVQKIITKTNKPIIDDSLPIEEICNTITEFNKNNIQTNKIKEMKEVLNYLGLENNSAEEAVLNAIKEKDLAMETVSNEIEDLRKKLLGIENEAKLENFLIENKLEGKKEEIQKTVEKYGIDVLNSLVINISNEVKEEEVKKEVENKVVEIVNEANDELNSIDKKGQPSKEEDLKLANSLFDVLEGDEIEANALKESDPAKYEKLLNLYYEIEE